MPRRPHRPGFSLVELLIVLVLLGVVIGALVSVSVTMQRQLRSQVSRSEATDALLDAEAFLANLLQGAQANPYQLAALSLLDPAPPGTTQNASFPWAPDTVALAFDRVEIVSDFNPANALQTDPFEDALIWVASDTLWVQWRTTAGGAMVNTPVATPIRSFWISYYSVTGSPVTSASDVPIAKQVRFRLEAPARDAQGTQLLRRDRWVYIRNP